MSDERMEQLKINVNESIVIYVASKTSIKNCAVNTYPNISYVMLKFSENNIMYVYKII